MIAHRRLNGTVTATVHVPYRLTREQMALLLARSGRYAPGVSARYGQSCIVEQLAADPLILNRLPAAPADARYAAALADVDRWHLFPSEPYEPTVK